LRTTKSLRRCTDGEGALFLLAGLLGDTPLHPTGFLAKSRGLRFKRGSTVGQFAALSFKNLNEGGLTRGLLSFFQRLPSSFSASPAFYGAGRHRFTISASR
jgi:hypothetical protein